MAIRLSLGRCRGRTCDGVQLGMWVTLTSSTTGAARDGTSRAASLYRRLH